MLSESIGNWGDKTVLLKKIIGSVGDKDIMIKIIKDIMFYLEIPIGDNDKNFNIGNILLDFA